MDGEPDDWPASHEAASALDSSLRCGICQDFYTTPLRPQCQHAFCSKCLRSWASGKPNPVCPTCRKPVDPQQLSVDPVLHAVADAFRRARPALLSAVTAPTQAVPAQEPPPVTVVEPRPATRASLRGRAASQPLAGPAKPACALEDGALGTASHPVTIDDDDDFKPPAAKKRSVDRSGSKHVECPFCQQRISRHLIEDHANRCLDRQAQQGARMEVVHGAVSNEEERNTEARRAQRPAPGGGGSSAAVPPLPKIAFNFISAKGLWEYCKTWNLLLSEEKAKQPKADAKQMFEQRWTAFMTECAVETDKHNTTGQAPSWEAAAKRVLRDVRATRTAALATHAFFASPVAAPRKD